MKKLVLASASLRRQALLAQAGISFDVITEDFDESVIKICDPAQITQELARRKADLICKKYNLNAIVLAADTIVWHNGKVLGKPVDGNDAYSMLNLLQGEVHYVYTGVCIIDATDGGRATKTFSERAEVKMRAVSEHEIMAYIGTGEPFGKAGAYAIQGKGAFLIEEIHGDYNTIVGLPLMRVCMNLCDLDFDVSKCW